MKKLIKNLPITFTIILLGLVFGFHFEAYGQGLENLESGIRRGTSSLVNAGLLFGAFMYAVGGICLKFNTDRGRQIIVGTTLGVIFLTIGTGLPDLVGGFFN